MATILWLDDSFRRPLNGSEAKKRLTRWKDKLADEIGENILIANDNYNQFSHEIHERRNLGVIAILNTTAFMRPFEEPQEKEPSLKAFIAARNICVEFKVPFIIFSDDKQEDGENILFSTECETFKCDDHSVNVLSPRKRISKDEENCFDTLEDTLKTELEHLPWQGYEFMESLITDGFIAVDGKQREQLVGLIQSYKIGMAPSEYNSDNFHGINKFDTAYIGIMRIILERMFDILREKFADKLYMYKEKNFKDLKNNDIKDYICKICPKKEGQFDYDNPCIPFNYCPKQIKFALDFLWESVNTLLHKDNSSNEDKQQKKGQNSPSEECSPKDIIKNVSEYYARMIYDAFFLIIRWFSIFMEKEYYTQIINLDMHKNHTTPEKNTKKNPNKIRQ